MPDPADALLRSLDPTQQAAIEADEHTLIVACPGSGKTRALVAKALRALRAGRSVVLLTFTREAAEEIRGRMGALVSESELKRLEVATFHALCKQTLDRMGRMEGVHLMDGGEQRLYYSRTADACGLEIEQVTQIIEAIKTSPIPQSNSDAAVVYRVYKNLIDKNRYWDFADLIRVTVEGMSDGSIAPWDADLMLVDEFQDTDALQYELIRSHRTRSQLTVAGDDDQEIYGFRHAMGTAGMLRFEKEFRARRFVFGRNYRSTREIVDSSSRLIRRNMQRVPKAIYAVRQQREGPAGQDCAEIVHPTVLEEARDALLTMVGDLQANPGGTGAILARTNRHLYLVKAEYEMAGEEWGVPASVRNTPLVSLSVGGLESDTIGAVLMTLLRTLVWAQEKRGIETLMVHFLGYPSGVVDPLIRRGFGNLIQALSNLKAAEVRGALHTQMVQMANAHPIWVENLREAQGAEYGKVLSSVTRQIVRWMCSVIQDSPQGEYTQRDERILWALRHQVLALGGRPLEVRLRQMRESEREAPKGLAPGTLALVTMHGAKGMEFDRVWILQCNQGVAPHKQNPIIEEERRLFYVAMTRARNHLYMSRDMARPASVFLSEIHS